MNWNAIAAVGELAGAVAVVVSLLYLARQISQNTRATRRTASHDAVEGMLNWFSHALADPDLTRIWTRACGRAGRRCSSSIWEEYWEQRRLLFSKRFQEYVNGFETDPRYLRTQAFAKAGMSGPKN